MPGWAGYKKGHEVQQGWIFTVLWLVGSGCPGMIVFMGHEIMQLSVVPHTAALTAQAIACAEHPASSSILGSPRMGYRS